jgi:eukaryotic-like serine/threonine-protein kinase
MQSQGPTHTDPLLGTVVAGRYRVIKPLGEGGMGVVYLAEHIAIEKRVALKVLRAEYAHKGEIVTRFQQEAISASRIKHPNVLDVFDFGQLDNGCFYLAMEFLEGNDLADDLVRHRTMEPARGIRIALQICRALSAAHSKGVVHRDMKPENVFLQRTADGEEIIKIVDFGIAQLRSNDEAAATETKPRRLTRTGMIFGTPEYMAPEQASGRHADLRADVYAVGIILYEMFTGAVPFTGETFLSVLTRHLHDPPPPMHAVCPDLAISPQLQEVIMRALVKDPAQRYQTMAEFSQAILSSPEATLVGRASFVPADHSGSFAPPAPGTFTAPQFTPNPTHAQFAGAPAPPRSPSAVPTQSATDAARAQTDLGAETSAAARTPSKPKAGVAFALIGGLLLLAGGAAIVTVKRLSAQDPPAADVKIAATATAAPVQAPPITPEAPPRASAAPAAAPSAAPVAGIRLSVTSEPEGATVLKNGFQVCDSTPCEVLAAPNETLELEGKKGALRGKAKVLAQRDQKVLLKLAGGAAPKPQGPAMCEVIVDDLKILRPCP